MGPKKRVKLSLSEVLNDINKFLDEEDDEGDDENDLHELYNDSGIYYHCRKQMVRIFP